MTNQAFPSLNDVEPSWADIAVTATVNGGALVDMADISAITWSRSVEVGERRGASGGRVIKALMALAPQRGNQRRISLVGFDIMVQHTPPGEDEIYQTKIKGCRYLGDSEDNGEGSDADTIEVTLSPIEIVQIIDGEEVALI
jgi:hypothetical protein